MIFPEEIREQIFFSQIITVLKNLFLNSYLSPVSYH